MEKKEFDYARFMSLLEQMCEIAGGRFVPEELGAQRIKEGDYNSIREFVNARLESNSEFALFWNSSSWQSRADHLSNLLHIYVDKNSLLRNFNRH